MRDFFGKMLKSIKTSVVIILGFFKKYMLLFLSKISKSFDKCMKGEEHLNKMLWCWCIIPNILFISKYFTFLYQFKIMKIFILLYSVMCFYFILKAVKIHPEYNVSEMDRIKEMEYIDTLKEDELKKYIKLKNTNRMKDFCKKALLQKAWRSKEFYKITEVFLLFIFLFTLLKLF